ncbi:MAG: exo-alpha-sialidase [Clostridia bacterium]|nr:exo-alpha-sialidase [Clostridia bacterium]
MQLKKISELNTQHTTDSHAGECGASRLMPDFRETVTLEGQSHEAISSKVYYPRVKKLANGKYIMLHMDYRLGGNVFISLGDDIHSFTARQKLFGAYYLTRDDGEEDRIMYANGEAAVLPNGDLIVVASFRYNKGYGLDAKYGGIVMRRSKDNGLTFDEEKVIYVGRNWEPYILVKKDGEIQIYFSHTAPKFYLDKTVRTDSPIKTSSGTAIIRSYDNGETWVPDVKEAPYAAWRVSQSYVATMENGTKCFTNQMATAVELGDGSIAVATESDLANYTFRLTVGYTHDNFAHELGIDEEGPEDIMFAFEEGAGPYMAHFESGETVLSYNWTGFQHIRIGDENGKNFDKEHELIAFGGRWGYWGSLFVDGHHTLISAYPNISEIKDTPKIRIDNDLMIGKLRLNHRIDALPITAGWTKNTDALFVGALSQAQASIRVAHDSEHINIRVDRLDKYLTEADGIEIRIKVGENVYKLYQNLAGKTYFELNNVVEGFGASATCHIVGEMNKWCGSDNGAITEFEVPLEILGGATEFEIDATLKNSDGLDLVTENLGGYFPVKLK